MCVVAPEPPSAYLGDLTDDKLVAAFRSGVDEAFAELDRRHRAIAVAGGLLAAGLLRTPKPAVTAADDRIAAERIAA